MASRKKLPVLDIKGEMLRRLDAAIDELQQLRALIDAIKDPTIRADAIAPDPPDPSSEWEPPSSLPNERPLSSVVRLDKRSRR